MSAILTVGRGSEDDMHLLTPFLAHVLDDERRAHAERRALAARCQVPARRSPSSARRRLALLLAAISRSSAGAVRRLDACLADDLAGQLASSR
jgi:hypothetical protein